MFGWLFVCFKWYLKIGGDVVIGCLCGWFVGIVLEWCGVLVNLL